jgi:hypothetical protein
MTSGESGTMTSNGVTYGDDVILFLRQRSGRGHLDQHQGQVLIAKISAK